jgi:hypothetical protein
MGCTDPGFVDSDSLGSPPVVMPGGWMLGNDVVTAEVPTIGQVLKDRMDKTVAGQSVEQHLMVMFEAKEQMGL